MSNQRHYDKYKRDKESRVFYKSNAWEKCREVVLKRDDYLCQDCLKKGKLTPADMVHHIEELKDNPDRALDIDNLESLCNPCHNKHHSRHKPKEKAHSNKIKVVKARKNPEVT